jgi:hypothetical protein
MIAAICAVALVFGISGWRFFAGESPLPAGAKPPVAVAAKAQVPAPPSETVVALNQLDLSQQLLVDDLQLLHGRVTTQETEIRRLKSELLALGQKYETLSSFASTAKEARQAPAIEPPRKKRKRYVKRFRKKL